MSDKPRVLVVEDEVSIGLLAREVLEAHGVETVQVPNVAEAVEAFAIEPAVAIIDKNLPDGSGLDLIPTLRQRWPDAEAVIYTGYPSLESAVEALRLGATDYLIKPLRDVSELWQCVRAALERRSLKRAQAQALVGLRAAREVVTEAKATGAGVQALDRVGKILDDAIARASGRSEPE